jgi:hypothetical protein
MNNNQSAKEQTMNRISKSHFDMYMSEKGFSKIDLFLEKPTISIYQNSDNSIEIIAKFSGEMKLMNVFCEMEFSFVSDLKELIEYQLNKNK